MRYSGKIFLKKAKVVEYQSVLKTKAIYIRLGDWSFLNGGKTNFVEVF